MDNKFFKLIFLIPVLDEDDNIDFIIQNFLDKYPDCLIVFIVTVIRENDRTFKRVIDLSHTHSNIKYVLNHVRGLGLAYTMGIKHVLKNFRFDFLCTLDADGSHGIEYVKDMLAIAVDTDVVIASRYICGGKIIEWGRFRSWGSYLVNFIIRRVSSCAVYDYTSGFKIYSRSILEKIKLNDLSRGFVFQVEILFKIIIAQGRYREIPYVFRNRRFGRSKFKISEFGEYFSIVGTISLFWFFEKMVNYFRDIFWMIKIFYIILLVKIKNTYKIFRRPYRLMIKITDKCNFFCPACGNWRKRENKYLSKDNLELIFKNFNKDIFFLTITGGEPFLDDDYLMCLVESAKKYCPNLKYLSINTNGFDINRITKSINNILQRYLTLKIYIGLSYWPDKKCGIEKTGIEDSFARSKKTVEQLSSLRRIYRSRLNFYRMFTIDTPSDYWGVKVFPDDVWLNFAVKDEFYNNLSIGSLGVDTKEQLNIIDDYLTRYHHRLGFLNLVYLKYHRKLLITGKRSINCYAGINRIFVKTDGRLNGCSRGMPGFDLANNKCHQCFTACEVVFDAVQNLFI